MNPHERGKADADSERDGGGHPFGRLFATEQVEQQDSPPPRKLQRVFVPTPERTRDREFHRGPSR
jgi:hypothetical protein